MHYRPAFRRQPDSRYIRTGFAQKIAFRSAIPRWIVDDVQDDRPDIVDLPSPVQHAEPRHLANDILAFREFAKRRSPALNTVAASILRKTAMAENELHIRMGTDEIEGMFRLMRAHLQVEREAATIGCVYALLV